MKHEEVRSGIEAAAKDFRELFEESGRANQLQLRFHRNSPAYTYYRFGDRAVFALYKHQAKRATDVPSFMIDGGAFSAFFKRDFEEVFTGARVPS
jgi:hypothetical protein